MDMGIPLYFFVGGAAGAAGVIGAIADYTGADRELVSMLAGSPPPDPCFRLPCLFPTWADPTLPGDVAGVQAAEPYVSWSLDAFRIFQRRRSGRVRRIPDDRYGSSLPVRVLENAGQAASLAFGLPFSNYTGVLIGATAIPVWNRNAADLPLHFAASGVGAAVGMLELMGRHKSRALQALGLGAAIFETWEGLRIEGRSHSHLDPLKYGASGLVTRAGGVLSGPIPTFLRIAGLFSGKRRSHSLRRWAACSAIAGSLITRFAWIHAGHVSARDWKLPLKS